ncbi:MULTISPECIES: hypothetical protein [unclassified Aureimonas]|uniref:hypothetical protein n=1 Tax=unclassified Aureimonas TaxID=2615206 RepID=UPI0006FB2D7D|nr:MULTISPECIES: hypothetical protein [unclassified Aureimonas]KQT65851.1 hypothetical protein ASG62_21395 [Aureimonas sp. Leaf427]KQT78071.1 hypothetical protein ASG54_03360 [Aureimonas sp. Leaf460]
MPRVSQHPKGDTFNFRVDPALKTAFTQATEAEDRPAAQVLREFMRGYVERRNRKALEAEARRQSLAIAERARDPDSDEARSLRELDALVDEDHFADEWKA